MGAPWKVGVLAHRLAESETKSEHLTEYFKGSVSSSALNRAAKLGCLWLGVEPSWSVSRSVLVSC